MRKKLAAPQDGWDQFLESCDDPQRLADMVFGWRCQLDITAEIAAELLGLPVRTLNGIEQGRGFRYPRMLTFAMIHLDKKWTGIKAALKAKHKQELTKDLAIMRQLAPQYVKVYEKALRVLEERE